MKLQAASRVLWTLPSCSAVCTPEVLAGPAEDTLTALVVRTASRDVLVENVTLAKRARGNTSRSAPCYRRSCSLR